MSDQSHRLTRTRLLAGAIGTRGGIRPRPGTDARWFEPPHVRDPRMVRSELTSQVEAGADVIVAPAYRTHRRALVEVGESRNARAWTAAAISVAREAVQQGLAGRADAGQSSRSVLVCGPLPVLDPGPGPGDGRLPTGSVAGERDYRDQAGILSDLGVDLILVDGQATVAGARLAMGAAVETGLPAWVLGPIRDLRARADSGESGESGEPGESGHRPALPTLASGEPLEAWAEAVLELGASALLLEGGAPGLEAGRVTLGELALGRDFGLAVAGIDVRDDSLDVIRAWLESDLPILGIAEGATAERLRRLASLIDEVEAAHRTRASEATARWSAWLAEAAQRAPGGPALWLERRPRGPVEGGAEPPPLPSGFAWTRAAPDDVPHLPRAHYRLVALEDGDVEVDALAPLLEPGGVLAARLRAEPRQIEGLRVMEIERDGDRVLVLARREP